MEIIELNNSNCKEYTDEQFEAKMNEYCAKKMIEKDNKLAKEMAATWIPNIMKVDNELSRKYKRLSNSFIAHRKAMIEQFGSENFSAYNIAGKKNKLTALLTGNNKNRNAGFKLQNSKGNGYGNL